MRSVTRAHLIAVQSPDRLAALVVAATSSPSRDADILDIKSEGAIRSKLIAPPFYDGELCRRTRRYSPEASMRAVEDFIISGDLSVPTCRSTRSYGAFVFKRVPSKGIS